MSICVPPDVFETYLYRNSKFILVKDVKHTPSTFHYTIWYVEQYIRDIFELTPEVFSDFKKFIEEIKFLCLFENERMYFTYPPTIHSIHLHILPITYISHRPLNEQYNFNDIHKILYGSF